MVANFGASMALMVPLTYGLAVRISELAPGHEEVLGYVTGIISSRRVRRGAHSWSAVHRDGARALCSTSSSWPLIAHGTIRSPTGSGRPRTCLA